MSSFHGFQQTRSGRQRAFQLALRRITMALAACLALCCPAFGQVVPSADAGGLVISVGATGSGYTLQYGERKMIGVTGFFDADTIRRFGVEGEARWLIFHQTENVSASTYMAGPRYHFDIGKFQPYAKGLVGVGEFNFPYGLAHGGYLVVAPGGGVDYRMSKKITFRLADFEYQYWPQFTFGAMTSVGVSTGFRVRVF
jgi:hypothetical protein